MMKFRKGNLVEVLRRGHDPYGFWFPGTIVSVCGNDYVVRYKFLLDAEGEPALEKVRGVEVRPLPLHETGNGWRVGDIAEVFDNKCWRVGKIAKVLPKNAFVVRLFGSVHVKEFNESNLRIRKSWHYNRWSVTGKVAGDKLCSTKNYSKHSLDLLSSAPSLKMDQDVLLGVKDELECHGDGHKDSKMYIRMGARKRCHADNSGANSRDVVIAGSHKKRKSSPLVGGCDKPLMGTLLLKHVADVSFSSFQLDEKFVGGSTEMDAMMVRETTDRFLISSTPPLSNDDSDQCSIASCSSSDFDDSTGRNVRKSVENTFKESDAESSFPSLSGKKDKFPSLRHRPEVGIHVLELHAYESTVRALYASGPLSWEQESLLTNLRLFLNISDEEHLLQLRHLLSGQVV